MKMYILQIANVAEKVSICHKVNNFSKWNQIDISSRYNILPCTPCTLSLWNTCCRKNSQIRLKHFLKFRVDLLFSLVHLVFSSSKESPKVLSNYVKYVPTAPINPMNRWMISI